ncbi:MAG: glycosyltransferase family 9 protein [Candidatus Zixiibacteriota bacterium]
MAGRIERGLKRLGHAWLRRVSPPPGRPPGSDDLAGVSRILVVRLDDRLGNVVLLTPLLQALRDVFPSARLSLVLARRYWEMREYLPMVDGFIAFERQDLARNPFRIRSFIRQLRAGRFDLAFDASDDSQVSFNHLMATSLSGAKFRIGHARGDASGLYEVAVPVPKEPRHAVRMHLDLLRSLVPVISEPIPRLSRPEGPPGNDREFRRRFGFRETGPIALLHPGGRGPKRWTASFWVMVARSLHQNPGMDVGLVWGPSDEDAARAVMELAGETIRPVGVLPLAEFLPAVCRASVFLSGDCGPMHVASALRTPVVSVFLVSDAGKYGPLGERDVVFDARRGDFGPDDVAAAVKRILIDDGVGAAGRGHEGQTGEHA